MTPRPVVDGKGAKVYIRIVKPHQAGPCSKNVSHVITKYERLEIVN